jgi:YD repeat-containing protein
VTIVEYDELNRQAAVQQAVATVDTTLTNNYYDAVGNLRYIINGQGYLTEYVYDELNRQIQIIDPQIDLTETKYYDTPALVAQAILLELPTTIIDPDLVGKIVKSIDANGYSTLTVYDLQGRLTDTYDATRHRTSHQTYYNDDRIKTATDTFGKVTTYTYQDNLRQITIVDPLGVTAWD